MLKTEHKRISYHGWDVEVMMENNEFFFGCYPPDSAKFCNDGSTYPSLKSALAAAYHHVDREIAIMALLEVAWEWLEDDKISEDEYWNLTDFA